MALYAHLHHYTRAVMLFYSDPAAQTFLKPVSTTFTKLGGTILKTVIVTPDQTSYVSQVRSVLATHPQVIFTQEDPPTAAVLFREFKQLGGQNIPWIGTDVTSGSDYLKAIGYSTAHAHLISVFGTSITGTAPVRSSACSTSSTRARRPRARSPTPTTPTTRSSPSHWPTTTRRPPAAPRSRMT